MITAGLPESMLAKAIEAWENALPPYLKLAYLPNPGAVRLRLSINGSSFPSHVLRRCMFAVTMAFQPCCP